MVTCLSFRDGPYGVGAFESAPMRMYGTLKAYICDTLSSWWAWET